MKDDHPKKAESRAALESIKIFRGLDEAAFRSIAKLVKWKNYVRGEEVVPYQGESDDVYFIASGLVRVTIYSSAGKEISYQDLGPGEMFGELSAIDQLPRTANVITVEPSQIGVISGRDYRELVNRYPSVAEATLKRLANLVRFLIDRVYQYGALDVKDRVRMEVLRLARENLSSEDSARIPDFPTHKEIANRVNTHREAVTRELNELSRMGLVEQDGRTLKVTAISGLIDLLPEYI